MSVRPDELLDTIDMSKAPPPDPSRLQGYIKKSQEHVEALVPPLVPAGLGGELEKPEHLETSPGFPIPEASDHGTEEKSKDQPDPQLQGLGTVATEHLMPPPDWYVKALALKAGHGKAYWQFEQSSKIPKSFETKQGVLAPQDGSTPVQLLGRNGRRRAAVIYNTGTNTAYLGSTPNDAMNNGFTLPAGGTFTMEHQASVYAWVAQGGSLTQTTLDTYETFFENGL